MAAHDRARNPVLRARRTDRRVRLALKGTATYSFCRLAAVAAAVLAAKGN